MNEAPGSSWSRICRAARPVCLAVVIGAAMVEVYDGAFTRIVSAALKRTLDVTDTEDPEATAVFLVDPPQLARSFSADGESRERIRAAMILVEQGRRIAWALPAHLKPQTCSRNAPDSGLPHEVVNHRDGSELVLVPPGPFAMGSDASAPAPQSAECPIHMVTLPAYYVGRTEVTRGQYEAFCRETGHPRIPRRFTPHCPRSDDPIVGVTVDDARAYCAWAGAGLPTEAQWEKAARGTDGRHYPWGNERPNVSNVACANFGDYLARRPSQERGTPGPMPAGSFPDGASPYGALDMAGNVHEWCYDLHDPHYYRHSPSFHPMGASHSTRRVIRGGCWSSDVYSIRTFARSSRIRSNVPDKRIGFRIVVNLIPRVQPEGGSTTVGVLNRPPSQVR